MLDALVVLVMVLVEHAILRAVAVVAECLAHAALALVLAQVEAKVLDALVVLVPVLDEHAILRAVAVVAECLALAALVLVLARAQAQVQAVLAQEARAHEAQLERADHHREA